MVKSLLQQPTAPHLPQIVSTYYRSALPMLFSASGKFSSSSNASLYNRIAPRPQVPLLVQHACRVALSNGKKRSDSKRLAIGVLRIRETAGLQQRARRHGAR